MKSQSQTKFLSKDQFWACLRSVKFEYYFKKVSVFELISPMVILTISSKVKLVYNEINEQNYFLLTGPGSLKRGLIEH